MLDLGSGGGIDVLLSARRVGPSGRAFGLDMTDEMLSVAEENKRKSGLENVTFLKGEIENIPLPDNSDRRDHFQLRDQSVGRQGSGAARSVSRAEARRQVCDFRRRGSWRRAVRDSEEHGALGRLRRRRVARFGVHGQAAERRVSSTSESKTPGSTAWKMLERSSPPKDSTSTRSRARSTAPSSARSFVRRSRAARGAAVPNAAAELVRWNTRARVASTSVSSHCHFDCSRRRSCRPPVARPPT